MSASRGLLVERKGSSGEVVLLTMDRPEVRNAIDDALLDALLAAVRMAAGDPAVRALVLAGSGGTFSAGMDLRERAGFSDAQLREQHGRIVELMTALTELPVPAIAAVEGFCLAGGFRARTRLRPDRFRSRCAVRPAGDAGGGSSRAVAQLGCSRGRWGHPERAT